MIIYLFEKHGANKQKAKAEPEPEKEKKKKNIASIIMILLTK